VENAFRRKTVATTELSIGENKKKTKGQAEGAKLLSRELTISHRDDARGLKELDTSGLRGQSKRAVDTPAGKEDEGIAKSYFEEPERVS